MTNGRTVIGMAGKVVRIGVALALAVALVLTVALLAGCSEQDNGKNPGNGAATEPKTGGVTTTTTGIQEDKQKIIMDEFNALLAGDAKLTQIVGYIDENIPLLSKQNASIMINELEKVQKDRLQEFSERFDNEKVQNAIYKLYKPGTDIDMNKIDDVDDKELKELLLETRDSGYKVETAEGTYFPIIDYESYKKYGPYVMPDIKEYIDIMAVESGKWPAKDAALVISWDELLKRALRQEKFVSQYPDSPKIKDVKKLYKKYATFALFGTDNTPLFGYITKTMVDEAKSVYIEAVKNNESSELLNTLSMFLDKLEKSNYKMTDEIEEYRQTVLENM